ncbi:MAG: hypothetical protein KOO60_14490 [Gemmatimonadales bacterium]|nr:hypothetical protein [Gemmatimonadales bacterium]
MIPDLFNRCSSLKKFFVLLLAGFWLAALWGPANIHSEAFAAAGLPPQVIELNLGDDGIFTSSFQDSVLAVEAELPVPARVAAWARRFLAAPGVGYLFGPAGGGYVAEGRLVLDTRHDCVSLMYRCSELGRADSAVDALEWALRTRFAGGTLDSLIGRTGRVDYDSPEHLDFSLDMIRSGYWGSDITADLNGAVPDSAGSSRYPAGDFVYVPSGSLVGAEIFEGDIVWLVLDPGSESGRKLRQEFGLVIGHLGIVIREGEEPWIVHAASRGLPGYYENGGVVKVPLAVYLSRVEKFCGVVVTRF